MVWYFIGVYKINTTLQGRLEIRNFCSCVEEFFTRSLLSLVKYFFNTLGDIIYLLYSQTFTQLNRDCHWLILGHVALTKIKCIPIVIHEAMHPARDTLQYVIKAWWKVSDRRREKPTLPVFFFVNEHNNTNTKPQANKQ